MRKTQNAKDTELLKYDAYCQDCDADIISDDTGKTKFCPECGNELLQPFRCLICNTPINASSKYCTGCGMIAVR